MSFQFPKKRIVVKGIFPTTNGYRTIAGRKIYFRSGWEANYARYLQFLKEKGVIKEWDYEPQSFIFEKIQSGTRKYVPDFRVVRPDGTHYFVEVKGYMDSKSKTKIARFKKYFPKEELIVVQKDFFRGHQRNFPAYTETWEAPYSPAEDYEEKGK